MITANTNGFRGVTTYPSKPPSRPPRGPRDFTWVQINHPADPSSTRWAIELKRNGTTNGMIYVYDAGTNAAANASADITAGNTKSKPQGWLGGVAYNKLFRSKQPITDEIPD